MNTKKVLYILTLILLFLGSGCVNHKEPAPPDSPKVLLELYSEAENYYKPAVRAGSADETNIGSPPWVLVFQGGDDYAVFKEVQQSFILGAKTYVALEKNESPCRILIIANPPAVFRDAGGTEHPFDQQGLEAQFTGRTLSYVAANLITSPLLAVPQPTVPYTPGLFLPMSALLDVNSIDNSTVINSTGMAGASELKLSRIVAKAIVDATAAGPAFTLLGATATGTARSGALVKLNLAIKDNADNLTDYISPSGDGVTGIAAAVGNTTAPNPIYMYESAETPTSIIIKGNYNGTEGYYRLGFRIQGTRIDVRRNHSYTFVINSVTGPGYATLGEALSSPLADISFDILVTDLSTDIRDNGQYYLGVTNSEFVVYENALDMFIVPAVTVSTDAPIGTATGIQLDGPGLSLSDPGQQISVTGTVAATDININMSSEFTRGTITVTVGNLSKTISVRREARLSFAPIPILFPANYVVGEVTSGSSWLGFSLTPDPAAAAAKVRNNNSPGDIYMIPAFNTTSFPRSATAYLSRSDNEGRVKVYAIQGEGVTATTIANSFVGTFHRNDQIGERVIQIFNVATNGVWDATVIAGTDFITLDTNVRPGYPYNDTNAENYPVTDGSYSVSGTGTDIQFRVGLKSKLPQGAAPRYGLIIVTYGGTGAGASYKLLYVRQGEQADYLMRPGDPLANSPNAPSRVNAAKFVPYNISDSKLGGGPDITDHSPIQGKEGVFTEYPSQAGYLFLWNLSANTDYRRAFNPSIPAPGVPIAGFTLEVLSYSWNPANDVCPEGYRHANDGVWNAAYTTVFSSEFRQSLFLNPSPSFGVDDFSNSVFGRYADGWSDRQDVGISPGASVPSGTIGTGAQIAYVGRLFYNPYNNASLFFPAGGVRSANTGILSGDGANGIYWTTSTGGGGAAAFMSVFGRMNNQRTGSAGFARCVKE